MSLNISIQEDKPSVIRVSLGGRLDTITAPELEQELDQLDTQSLSLVIFDMETLEYISSAGLRVIFKTVKTMKEKG